jgi:phenylalanyl-tRNA synthetase beta chain
LFATGNKTEESWTEKETPSTFYSIKTYAENILKRLGMDTGQLQISETGNELFRKGLQYQSNNKTVLEMGIVAEKWLKKFDIGSPVYYADLDWGRIIYEKRKHKVVFQELPKFPAVRRDLALLIDKGVQFNQIKESAFKIERQILRSVNLFDVYEGKGVPEGKKSYAVSFVLRDDNRTLKDKQIDKTMKKLLSAFERDFGAQLR